MAPSGRLSSVKACGYAWLNATRLYPYISIYAAGRDEEFEATRLKKSTCHYVLGVAYKSSISLEDAYTQIYTLLDDGNGNGLEAVLRDPANYTWGHNCSYSTIKTVRYYDNFEDNNQSAQTTFVAYATVLYDTVQLLTVSGALS